MKNQERLLKIILSPHISEKATLGAEKNNEYVFQVIENATKPEIKDAVESLFNTKVKSVRIVNVIAKEIISRPGRNEERLKSVCHTPIRSKD